MIYKSTKNSVLEGNLTYFAIIPGYRWYWNSDISFGLGVGVGHRKMNVKKKQFSWYEKNQIKNYLDEQTEDKTEPGNYGFIYFGYSF